MDQTQRIQIIVIGAGPAGLTAALYLARYRRSVLILHDGQSRALRIPKTYNVPSYPDGIEGPELIKRMTDHAVHYGAAITQAEVTGVDRVADEFCLTASDHRTWRSRALILATGVRLNQIDLPLEEHEAAIARGVLRYCPVCDGYEHIDKKIGVVGCDSNGAAEALFLRQFSREVTLMPLSHSELTQQQTAELTQAKVTVVQGALRSLTLRDGFMDVYLREPSAQLSFDVIYPALGTTPRSELAASLQLAVTDKGCLPGDAPHKANVEGLFAAGDVVAGLDQISVAIGQGAIAATNAHNWLRECDGHTLRAK